MRVSHYFEWEKYVTGGHAQSVRNQRKILDRQNITYTTEPDLDADLLHLNNMGPRSLLCAKRARRRDVPVLVHAHQTAADFKNSFAFSNLLARPMRPYLEYAYAQADHLVCPSEHNREVVEGYADVPTTVISNGFDPEKLAGYDDDSLRASYRDRFDLEPPVVFTVAHVLERKGLPAFVETARRLPDIDFAWFGYLNPTGGTLDRVLRSRETDRLVEAAPDNCTFTGYVDDIRGAYAAGDIFFFPTRNENEGMALLEAMACAAPPVVRDIETFDWLADGEDCLKADSVAGFVEAIERLRDPDLRGAIGRRAADRSDAYRLENVGDQLIELYRHLT